MLSSLTSSPGMGRVTSSSFTTHSTSKGGATAELVTGATVAVAIGAALIEAGAITGANVAVATGAAYVVAGATTGAKVAVATGAA